MIKKNWPFEYADLGQGFHFNVCTWINLVVISRSVREGYGQIFEDGLHRGTTSQNNMDFKNRYQHNNNFQRKPWKLLISV